MRMTRNARPLFCVAVYLPVFLGATFAPAQVPVPAPAPPAETKLDLFLLVGQSNMSGRGKIEAQDRQAHPRVWVLNARKEWVPAVDPLHFDKPDRAGVGLGTTFGKVVAEKFPDAQIGLIPCAVGGTSLDEWAKGGKLYTAAIERARAAQQRGTLKAILWHQGEADCAPAKRATYLARLKTLIENFRADLKAPDVPFIAGQLGDFGEDAKSKTRRTFNGMILDLPRQVPGTAVVTTEGAKSVGDGTHFDAATLRELGRRYAADYFQLITLPRK